MASTPLETLVIDQILLLVLVTVPEGHVTVAPGVTVTPKLYVRKSGEQVGEVEIII